jgi:hypothetical protein
VVFTEEENRVRNYRAVHASAYQEEKQRRRERMEQKIRDREYNILTLQMYVQTLWMLILITAMSVGFGLIAGVNWPAKIKCLRTDLVCTHARVRPGLYLSK